MACWLSSTQLLWSFHWSCGLVKERASAAAAKAKPRFTVKVPWRVDVAQEASSTQVIDAMVMSCYVTLMLQDLWNDSHCNPSNYRILDVTCRAGWCFQTLPAFSKLPLAWGAVVFLSNPYGTWPNLVVKSGLHGESFQTDLSSGRWNCNLLVRIMMNFCNSLESLEPFRSGWISFD